MNIRACPVTVLGTLDRGEMRSLFVAYMGLWPLSCFSSIQSC